MLLVLHIRIASRADIIITATHNLSVMLYDNDGGGRGFNMQPLYHMVPLGIIKLLKVMKKIKEDYVSPFPFIC